MQRKRPAQRHSPSRSVVKTKTRSFVPARTSRSTRSELPKKKVSSSWGSKRTRRPNPKTSKSYRRDEKSSKAQSILLWIVLLIGGGWLVWFILIWGMIPKLIVQPESRTVALVPSTAGGQVLIVQLEPDLKDSKVFQLNGDENVTLPGQYGEYRLSAIYPLLLIDEKDDRYFRGTMNRVFGVFLDEELIVPTVLSVDTKELSAQIQDAFWQDLLSNHHLTLDYLRTWYVLQYNNTIIPLESVRTVVDEIRSLNGGTFATRDECRVAILNSTTTSGLAGGLADIVERNGGIVIRLGQYPNALEASRLLYDPSVAECTEAIEQIKTLSPVPFEVVEDSSVQGTFRAPLVAIIGKNFE